MNKGSSEARQHAKFNRKKGETYMKKVVEARLQELLLFQDEISKKLAEVVKKLNLKKLSI